jgi:hypothetical protein
VRIVSSFNVRATVLAVLLVVVVALSGCGPAGDRADAPARPAGGGVQQQEDIVNDLERVVGSAEADTDTDADTDLGSD